MHLQICAKAWCKHTHACFWEFCPCCDHHVHVSHHNTLSAIFGIHHKRWQPISKDTLLSYILLYTMLIYNFKQKVCTYCFVRALYWCRFPSPDYSLPHMCNSQNPPALHCRSELWSFSFKKKTDRNIGKEGFHYKYGSGRSSLEKTYV